MSEKHATCAEMREALLVWQSAWLYYTAPGPLLDRVAHRMQAADKRLAALHITEGK